MNPREIFAANHNATTVIRVLFGRDNGDGGVGLDVVLSGRVVARFYKPEDVNAWFQANSIKLLPTWKEAFHKANIKPEDFKLPAPTSVNLKVPYFSQRDNLTNPLGTCNVTSYAMCLTFFDVARKYAYKFPQFEDELSYFLETVSHKDRHVHGDLAWMGNQYGVNCSFATDRTWAQIQQELRDGHPVIVSGKFTKSGHIVVIRGFEGNHYIVNDPYGNALSKSRTRSSYADSDGNGVMYPFEYMHATVKAPKVNAKWAHFLRGKRS